MPQCAVITCGNTYRKVSGVRYHRFPPQDILRTKWKLVCGRIGTNYNCETGRVCSLHFSRDNYEKDLEHELLGLPPRTRLRFGAVPDIDIPDEMPPNVKTKPGAKKINLRKKVVPKIQNGQRNVKTLNKIKEPKKVLHNVPIKHNLNVNGRPVRVKKKTKKYAFYETEVKEGPFEALPPEESNVLLALGLTPVHQNTTLNKMHIMEDEDQKETLAETPKESQKTSIVAAATTTKADAPTSPKVNGVADTNGTTEPPDEEDVTMNEEIKGQNEEPVVPLTIKNDSVQVKVEKDVESSHEPQDLTVTCTSAFEMQAPPKRSNTPKVISISVEQLKNGTSESVKPKSITNRKRSNRSTDSDDNDRVNIKKYKFPDVDRLNDEREMFVSDFVDKASSSGIEDLQKNCEKLQQEIHSLSALARAKEVEWNHIIKLKKVKEEMFLRLQRRKHVILLTMTGGSGRVPENLDFLDYTQDHFLNDEISLNPVDPQKLHPKIPATLTISRSQNSPSQNMQRFLMQPQNSELKNNHQSLMMVPIVSSSPMLISSSSSKMHTSRPSLKIPSPEKQKNNCNNRNNLVPILPKPNPEHSPPIGRQGPIVDVKNLIADFRQTHPEPLPRRGRRVKGQMPSCSFADNLVSSSRNVLSMSSIALGSGSQVRTVGSSSNDYSYLMSTQDASRPSSADSNRSSSANQNDSGLSFKDVLVKFAKMSQGERKNGSSSTQSKPPIYPEVTLHPVNPTGGQSPPNPSSSLLHGILTKNAASGGKSETSSGSRPTTFSPTLARLLTTPERPPTISTSITTTAMRGQSTASCSSTSTSRAAGSAVSISDILTSSKNRNELTITPVVSQTSKSKEEAPTQPEEDPDEAADRLVIDESEEVEPRPDAEEIEPENVPQCQGCQVKSAQFVCAGCSNQWYCSRTCQVTAWDEHSEVCSG